MPGKWSKVHTPPKGAEFQKKVTGAPIDIEYVVDAPHTKSGKIKFDGYDPNKNKLIDSKDWENWPPKGQKWAEDIIIRDAQKQAKVFEQTGTRIEWHFPSQEKLNEIRNILRKNGIKGIDFILTPKN